MRAPTSAAGKCATTLSRKWIVAICISNACSVYFAHCVLNYMCTRAGGPEKMKVKLNSCLCAREKKLSRNLFIHKIVALEASALSIWIARTACRVRCTRTNWPRYWLCGEGTLLRLIISACLPAAVYTSTLYSSLCTRRACYVWDECMQRLRLLPLTAHCKKLHLAKWENAPPSVKINDL